MAGGFRPYNVICGITGVVGKTKKKEDERTRLLVSKRKYTVDSPRYGWALGAHIKTLNPEA